jgi:hypothetical protein
VRKLCGSDRPIVVVAFIHKHHGAPTLVERSGSNVRPKGEVCDRLGRDIEEA